MCVLQIVPSGSGKTTHRMRENICKLMFNKMQVSRIYKELLQLNNKKGRQKHKGIPLDISLKKINKWPKST